MARGRVIKTVVDALQPGERDVFLWDDELRGFGVKITPAGTRSYVYQFRLGGRESPTRRWTIGAHGSPWTPTLARQEAVRLAILVAQGIDPVAEAAERRRMAVDLAFRSYAAQFAENCVGGVGWRALVERSLRLYAVPHFKNKPLPTIKRSDISSLLDKIPREKVALRRNTFAVIRRLFKWAVNRGDIERSPCEGMLTPPAVTPRDRVLSDAELVSIWCAADAVGKIFGPVVRLLMTTGQRREEVAKLDWSELHQESANWTLPGQRAKNQITHVVPLSTLSVSLLYQLAGGADWPAKGPVFPTSGSKPFTAYARGKLRLDRIIEKQHGSPIAAWRLHDLRRTMATNFQKLGIRFEVTEAALNHVGGARAGVAGIYQRHDWQAEKRAAFEQWGTYLEGLIQNVS